MTYALSTDAEIADGAVRGKTILQIGAGPGASPRALRGNQMTDVIFAGSRGRSALGMAEVRMVIDNEAGLIPVPA